MDGLLDAHHASVRLHGRDGQPGRLGAGDIPVGERQQLEHMAGLHDDRRDVHIHHVADRNRDEPLRRTLEVTRPRLEKPEVLAAQRGRTAVHAYPDDTRVALRESEHRARGKEPDRPSHALPPAQAREPPDRLVDVPVQPFRGRIRNIGAGGSGQGLPYLLEREVHVLTVLGLLRESGGPCSPPETLVA